MNRALDALVAASNFGASGTMLDVALTLVDGGWPVFPCGQDKAPLVSGGFTSRTTDRAQVAGWWSVHPDALPGICPGDNELAALDVDTEKAAAAVNAVGFVLRKGFIVETGGTSDPFMYNGNTYAPMHLYVRASEQPKIPGVVVRYLGGYVIAPGARRGDRRYTVVHPDAPGEWTSSIVDIPKKTTIGDGPSSVRVALAVASIPNTEATDRDQYVAVAHMIKGALGDAGLDIFMEWAGRYPGKIDAAEDTRVFETITAPRTGWSELWRTAAQHGFDASAEVAADAQADFGDGLAQTAAAPAEDTRTKLNRMLVAVRDASDGIERALGLMRLRRAGFSQGEIKSMLTEMVGPVQSDEGMTLGDWLRSPELLKTPDPAIPYLAWPGLKTILSAREKCGKSTLALAGVVAATKGLPFLGEPTPKQRVLWLSEEAPAICIERCRLMGADHENLIVVPMGQNPQAQLKRAVKRWTPNIVVIDTLFRFAGVEGDAENDAGTWMPILLLFDEVTHSGAALLVLVHSIKHSDTGEYRGSSAIGGFVDAILEMRRPKDGERVRRLSGRGRLHFGKPFAVRLLTNETFEILRDADVADADRLQSTVLEYLGSNPGASATITAKVLKRGRQDVTDTLVTLEAGKQIMNRGTDAKPKWYLMPPEEEMDT